MEEEPQVGGWRELADLFDIALPVNHQSAEGCRDPRQLGRAVVFALSMHKRMGTRKDGVAQTIERGIESLAGIKLRMRDGRLASSSVAWRKACMRPATGAGPRGQTACRPARSGCRTRLQTSCAPEVRLGAWQE
jgi:hypothetical protein